jgi:type IV pilus assembly protein PilA
MRSRKGFTLIELMIVVIIVAVLAAIVVPLMTSRINKAKWSEAKAAMGQIATAVRAKVAEDQAVPADLSLTTGFGFKANELDGKYFAQGDYVVSGVTYTDTTGVIGYTITATAHTTATRPNPPTGGPLIMTCAAGVTTYSPTDL